jgi:hypothetical protein
MTEHGVGHTEPSLIVLSSGRLCLKVGVQGQSAVWAVLAGIGQRGLPLLFDRPSLSELTVNSGHP